VIVNFQLIALAKLTSELADYWLSKLTFRLAVPTTDSCVLNSCVTHFEVMMMTTTTMIASVAASKLLQCVSHSFGGARIRNSRCCIFSQLSITTLHNNSLFILLLPSSSSAVLSQ